MNTEGSLAGAHVTMAESVARLVAVVGVPVEVALRMGITIPARVIGAPELTRVAGRAADEVVVLDAEGRFGGLLSRPDLAPPEARERERGVAEVKDAGEVVFASDKPVGRGGGKRLFKRIDKAEQAAAVDAKCCLHGIGHKPGKGRDERGHHEEAARAPTASARGVSGGNQPYQTPPRVAPSGKPSMAVWWAMASATAGATEIMPGVSAWNSAAPSASVTSAVVMSATAARVPA